MKKCCINYIHSLLEEFKHDKPNQNYNVVASCYCGAKINIKLDNKQEVTL